MKKFIFILLTFFIFLTSCNLTSKSQTFSFGEDLVFKKNDGITTIDLEKSTDVVKKKHEELSKVLNSKEKLSDVTAVTTSTANILEQIGIMPTGAPESPILNKNISLLQYKVSNENKIDKTKVLNIGSAIAPNIEAILELNPKLVLYSDAMPKSDFLKTVAQSNIEVFALGQSDYIDMFILLDVLGKIENNEKVNKMMETLIKSLKESKDLIKETKEKKSVAILQVSGKGIKINNDDSVLGRITEALHMNNIFGKEENIELNKEQLLSLNPDYIIYYGHGRGHNILESFEKELNSEASIYRELKAFKNQKIFQVGNNEFKFSASVDFNIVKIIKFLAEKFYE